MFAYLMIASKFSGKKNSSKHFVETVREVCATVTPPV
jgi:hypothetical protein